MSLSMNRRYYCAGMAALALSTMSSTVSTVAGDRLAGKLAASEAELGGRLGAIIIDTHSGGTGCIVRMNAFR